MDQQVVDNATLFTTKAKYMEILQEQFEGHYFLF